MKADICEMKKEWVGQALEIYQWYVRNSTATFQISDISERDMENLLFSNDPRYGSWALLQDGRLLGYCILSQFKPREAFSRTAELTIYLSRASAGRGFGKLMLNHLETKAKERNMHSLIALVCGENEASIALFSKAGYSECARYHEVGFKFGKVLDLVCFEKILPDPSILPGA